MSQPMLCCTLSLLFCFSSILLLAESPAVATKPVVWNLDSLETIGGHKVTVVGKPRVIETDRGKAIEFDGKGDGLFIAANPLAGLKEARRPKRKAV